MIVENVTRSQILADTAHEAADFFSRGRGLMFSPPLPEGGGLVIEPCNSIHMFFMRFPLDVVFTDAEGRVVFTYKGIKPWRMGRIVKGAKRAIELPEGTVERTHTEVGDVVRLKL
jgi:uncharacterized membrane protein (UPF0127 family)